MDMFILKKESPVVFKKNCQKSFFSCELNSQKSSANCCLNIQSCSLCLPVIILSCDVKGVMFIKKRQVLRYFKKLPKIVFFFVNKTAKRVAQIAV